GDIDGPYRAVLLMLRGACLARRGHFIDASRDYGKAIDIAVSCGYGEEGYEDERERDRDGHISNAALMGS
ncbi:hypothetical protein KIPB_017083, partial [Kipferlia bialata]